MMDRYIALIQFGEIVSVAVAGDPPHAGWLVDMQDQYDYVVDVTEFVPRPWVGWSYDGATFTPPPSTGESAVITDAEIVQ